MGDDVLVAILNLEFSKYYKADIATLEINEIYILNKDEEGGFINAFKTRAEAEDFLKEYIEVDFEKTQNLINKLSLQLNLYENKLNKIITRA